MSCDVDGTRKTVALWLAWAWVPAGRATSIAEAASTRDHATVAVTGGC